MILTRILTVYYNSAPKPTPGRLDEAAALYEEALRGCRKVLGNREITTLISINNLGMLLQKQGKPAKAAPLLEEVLQAKRALLGDSHQSTLTSMNNLGVLLANDLGKLNEAGPLLKEALRGRRMTLGDRHQETLTSVLNMAELLAEQGRLEEAAALFEEELQACREMLGDDDQSTLRSIQNLADLRQEQASVKCLPCPRILAYSLANPFSHSLTNTHSGTHSPNLTYPLITHALTHSPTRLTSLWSTGPVRRGGGPARGGARAAPFFERGTHQRSRQRRFQERDG